ncbi:MAG: hypothetical protein MUQ56_00920, partial [Thermoleophilia bacterium]|nr:hypothetical protein [Thermoleophilia bacterium]
MFKNAYIPYGGYYSSPFARWQGSLQSVHSLPLAGATATRWLATKAWDPAIIDYVNFGSTVAQPYSFWGGPYAAALIGADRVPGVWISQACSTSTTCIYQAAMAVELGSAGLVFNLMADRTSNGPHTIWPNPTGPGGQVDQENWLMDNFAGYPWAPLAMVATAEEVSKAGEQLAAELLASKEGTALSGILHCSRKLQFPFHGETSCRYVVL